MRRDHAPVHLGRPQLLVPHIVDLVTGNQVHLAGAHVLGPLLEDEVVEPVHVCLVQHGRQHAHSGVCEHERVLAVLLAVPPGEDEGPQGFLQLGAPQHLGHQLGAHVGPVPVPHLPEAAVFIAAWRLHSPGHVQPPLLFGHLLPVLRQVHRHRPGKPVHQFVGRFGADVVQTDMIDVGVQLHGRHEVGQVGDAPLVQQGDEGRVLDLASAPTDVLSKLILRLPGVGGGGQGGVRHGPGPELQAPAVCLGRHDGQNTEVRLHKGLLQRQLLLLGLGDRRAHPEGVGAHELAPVEDRPPVAHLTRWLADPGAGPGEKLLPGGHAQCRIHRWRRDFAHLEAGTRHAESIARHGDGLVVLFRARAAQLLFRRLPWQIPRLGDPVPGLHHIGPRFGIPRHRPGPAEHLLRGVVV